MIKSVEVSQGIMVKIARRKNLVLVQTEESLNL